MATKTKFLQLEPAAKAFAQATANPPFLFEIPPPEGRKAVDEVQSSPVNKPDLDIEDLIIETGSSSKVPVRILRPQNAPSVLPVIMYIHGAGWVFGNDHTHDHLIRDLAVGAKAAVVFPNYSLAPETRYPTAIEECYTVLKWVADEGAQNGLDPSRIVIAGDSAGGNLAIAVTLIAKERGEPEIQSQLLFYPVTDANFDTESYLEFAEGYFLRRDGMMWFWDQYVPNMEDRNEITASPLRASIEQLAGLPPALIITAEADVLRDEGEAYANKLRGAGVPVITARFQGIIHDFVMLNALAETYATQGAMMLATVWLSEQLNTSK